MFDLPVVTDPGLADPGHQSQAIFRTVLAALSEPGLVKSIDLAPLPHLRAGPAAIAILLTLADGDTPLWLGDDRAALAAYLRFHTGAPIIAEPRMAQFGLLADRQQHRPLAAFNPGTEDFPDRSATLIMEVAHLAEQGPIVLRGPGIPGHRHVTIESLPTDFVAQWATNYTAFPCGLDLILTCGSKLMGLPRGIQLEGACM
jgi:alpha-D-ribose 1-methylphosphonate 5-triphosphate synthase subunit PhnH